MRLSDFPAYKVKIDIGCGARTKPGFIGLDWMAAPNVDIVIDLTKERLPFVDSTVDGVWTDHFLEHLDIEHVIKVMKEIHRVCKPNALVEIHVPHFSGYTNFYEFHKTSFRYYSFGEFLPGPHGMFKFAQAFHLLSRKIKLVNTQSTIARPITKWFFWNYPMEWLVNKMPWVYEMTSWCHLFPAWELIFKMRVVK